MRFQAVKCNIMQLTRKRIQKIDAVYSLERTVLENMDNIKYLGMTISKDLKWTTHVSNVLHKSKENSWFLKTYLLSCTQDVKEMAFNWWCDQSWSMLALFGAHMEQYPGRIRKGLELCS